MTNSHLTSDDLTKNNILMAVKKYYGIDLLIAREKLDKFIACQIKEHKEQEISELNKFEAENGL